MPDYSDRFSFDLDSLGKSQKKPDEKPAAKPAEADIPQDQPVVPVSGQSEKPSLASQVAVLEEAAPVQEAKPKVEQSERVQKKQTPPSMTPVLTPTDGKKTKLTSDSLSYLGWSQSDMVRTYVPKEILAVIRGSIPEAQNNLEALVTYFYIVMGRNLDVPDRIRELADGYKDDGGIADIQRQLADTQTQLRLLRQGQLDEIRYVRELEMMVLWLTAERLNYAVNMPGTPDRMDFLFPEAEALLARLRKQVVEQERTERLSHGRALYQTTAGKNDDKIPGGK